VAVVVVQAVAQVVQVLLEKDSLVVQILVVYMAEAVALEVQAEKAGIQDLLPEDMEVADLV
jgi:hypothetical protein